ncbi:MAG: uroporphyrinogen-III synthase [Planctomycetes bacterium]|nr:uroporphyrinogen-III synthase [Planctomycetota bacterium]
MSAAADGSGALPLWRRRIVLTRPRARSEEWIAALAAAGADVILYPVFVMQLPALAERREAVAAAREAAAEKAPWLAFTSAQAVESFRAILDEAGDTPALLARARVAVVGPATASAARECGFSVTFEAQPPTGEGLARELLARDPRPFVLHPTAARGLSALEDAVAGAGGIALRAVVTVQHRNPRLDPSLLEREFLGQGLDILTFASPSAVRHFFDSAPTRLRLALRQIAAVAIGPTTEQALRAGQSSFVERAESPTAADVVRACIACVRAPR